MQLLRISSSKSSSSYETGCVIVRQGTRNVLRDFSILYSELTDSACRGAQSGSCRWRPYVAAWSRRLQGVHEDKSVALIRLHLRRLTVRRSFSHVRPSEPHKPVHSGSRR